MSVKRIYFIRHGETDANLHEYIPSKIESLNAQGFLQAESVALRVNAIDVQKIYVSDFVRSQQTAAPIVATKGIVPVVESSFGEIIEPSSLWGKLENSENSQAHRKERNANVENTEWRYEDGETLQDVFARVLKAKSILEQETNAGVLVVSHSFFMQLFTAAILIDAQKATIEWFNLACRLKISNTGITLFEYSEEKNWRLILWNDHAHFAE